MSKDKLFAFNAEKQLQFIGVYWKTAAIETTEEFWQAPKAADSTEADINATLGTNVEQEVVRVEVQAKIKGAATGSRIGCSGLFTIQFDFRLKDIATYVEQEQLDSRVAVAVMGVAYSTARGMILERCYGTPLGGALLPIVNPIGLLNPISSPSLRQKKESK